MQACWTTAASEGRVSRSGVAWRGVMDTEKKPGSSYGARLAFLDTQRRVCLALLLAYAPRGVSSITGGEVLPTPVSSNFTNLPTYTYLHCGFRRVQPSSISPRGGYSRRIHICRYVGMYRCTNGPCVASESTFLLDERC